MEAAIMSSLEVFLPQKINFFGIAQVDQVNASEMDPNLDYRYLGYKIYGEPECSLLLAFPDQPTLNEDSLIKELGNILAAQFSNSINLASGENLGTFISYPMSVKPEIAKKTIGNGQNSLPMKYIFDGKYLSFIFYVKIISQTVNTNLPKERPKNGELAFKGN